MQEYFVNLYAGSHTLSVRFGGVRGHCSPLYKRNLDRKILYGFRVPSLHNVNEDQLLATIVYVWFTGDGGQGKEWEQ